MAVDKLIDIIINHLKGFDHRPEALMYITDTDREKYRTEVTRYVIAMTGLAKNTVDTRLSGQTRFKSLEILSLKKALSLSWGDVQSIFEPDIPKLMQLEQAHERTDVNGTTGAEGKSAAG